MTGTRVLVPDRQFATDHELENGIELFPRPEGPLPAWHLPFARNGAYTREIIRAKNRLAALYADRIYATRLPYRTDAMESFYVCLGWAITFLVGDRLLRLNRLFGEIPGADIVLPDVPYTHEPKVGVNDVYYRKIEANPYFNQWVVNALLPDLPRIPLSGMREELLGHEAVGIGPAERLRRQVAARWKQPQALLGYLWKETTRRTRQVPERIVYEMARRGRDLPCEYDAQQIQNLRKKSGGFFWPRGRLSPLQITLWQGDDRYASPTFTRADFASLEREVGAIFSEMVAGSGERIHLPESSFRAAARLISELLPSVVVEEVEAHAARFLAEMSQYRGRYYLCGSPYSGYDTGFRTFAARQAGKKVLSIQHSGWGGYLADGALVSELLIAGSDDYVTFGWTNEDPNVSSWKDRPIVLPSPMLSEMRRASGSRRRGSAASRAPSCRNILLSTGFVYRFPSVYNSFLRVDTVPRWSAIISDVLAHLTGHDLKVTLMMYNRTIARLHRSTLDGWLAIDRSRIVEHPNHDARVRHLMQSGSFRDQYDAVIWDLPAGGFSEALACDVPTFSLWNTDLIRSLPFAEPFIRDLVDAGVFFAGGADLSDTIRKFYTVPGWYDSDEVQKPIAAFADNFLLSDPEWEKPWAKFIDSL